jgi:hypothetical protein
MSADADVYQVPEGKVVRVRVLGCNDTKELKVSLVEYDGNRVILRDKDEEVIQILSVYTYTAIGFAYPSKKGRK